MFGMSSASDMKLLLVTLRMNGFVVRYDKSAMTAIVYDGPAVILRGLQKASGGPWINAYFNGPRFSW